MSASTAGVGLDPFYWLPQVACTFGPSRTYSVAGAVGGHPAGGGLYGAPAPVLARFARIDEDRVWPCLAKLVGEGYLEPARRGGGRGRPSLFGLGHGALFSAKGPLTEGRFSEERTPHGGVVSAKGPLTEGRFGQGGLPIELLTTTTSTGGGGDDFVVEADVLAVVLATLPAELRPRTARQRMQMAADIARWMGAGWTAAGIGQRARQGLKPGQVKYPDKLLAQLIPPEPPGPTGIVSSRPPARCPEHLADEPCRGCVIDRQLAERAAARGAS